MEGLAFYVLLLLMGIGLRGRMALVSLHSLSLLCSSPIPNEKEWIRE